MNVRTVIAGSILAAGVGVAGLAGAGAASPVRITGTPVMATAAGIAIAMFKTNVTASLANGNKLFNGT